MYPYTTHTANESADSSRAMPVFQCLFMLLHTHNPDDSQVIPGKPGLEISLKVTLETDIWQIIPQHFWVSWEVNFEV